MWAQWLLLLSADNDAVCIVLYPLTTTMPPVSVFFLFEMMRKVITDLIRNKSCRINNTLPNTSDQKQRTTPQKFGYARYLNCRWLSTYNDNFRADCTQSESPVNFSCLSNSFPLGKTQET